MPRADVVVIGAGLAGLSCAAELAEAGASVFVAAKGMATTHWTHGGLDVAAPAGATTPRDGVRLLSRTDAHPYHRLAAATDAAVTAHLARTAAEGLGHAGSLDAPLKPLPTAIGALRRAAVLPLAQAAALAPWAGAGLLVVGFRRFPDAWAAYAARNLAHATWPDGPAEIRGVEVDLPTVDKLRNLGPQVMARLFDDPAWRGPALAAIARTVPAGIWRIGMPAGKWQ